MTNKACFIPSPGDSLPALRLKLTQSGCVTERTNLYSHYSSREKQQVKVWLCDPSAYKVLKSISPCHNSAYAGRVMRVFVCMFSTHKQTPLPFSIFFWGGGEDGSEDGTFKNNSTAPVYSMNILWKFHSGLHELIIIVFAATGNALAKVTSLQGTAEEDAERWEEKCQGKVGLQTACLSKGSVRCTYRLDGVLVNFGLHLPQMMPIYRQKNMMWHLWHYDSLYSMDLTCTVSVGFWGRVLEL